MSVAVKSFWLGGWGAAVDEAIASLNRLTLMMIPVFGYELYVMSNNNELSMVDADAFSLVLNRNVVKLMLEPESRMEMILE